MDKLVIKKIIDYRGEPCPNFKFDNPLLDKNIAALLTKGFMKLLNHNSSNTNHRQSILESIRKSCKVEPQGHLNIDDNVTQILQNAYKELPNNSNLNKSLDSFLIRSLKEMDVHSTYHLSLKPDIIQAIFNLNDNRSEIQDILLKDLIHWNIDKHHGYLDILESMWTVDNVNGFSKSEAGDLSIKMKPLIEKTLLKWALEMLSTVIVDGEEIFSEEIDLINLRQMCSISGDCFQICCSILNAIFIETNFDKQMHQFIRLFIDSIQLDVESIFTLYPSNLQPLVLLLDIELNNLQADIKEIYVKDTLKKLHNLQKECEFDLIMLLSHFNEWFDYYYRNEL